MKPLTAALLDGLAARAAASPRRRAHHNLHEGNDDLVQRFLVVALPGSYVRPHRHRTKSELATVLRGAFDVLLFDEEGRLTGRERFGEGCEGFGWEAPAGAWHTLVPREPVNAFLEVKQGPYDPATAAEFAPWAPAEGAPGQAELQRWFELARPGERFRS